MSYHCFNTYVCFFVVIVFYILPLITTNTQTLTYATKNSILMGRDLTLFCSFVFLCFFTVHLTRYLGMTGSCFGHLIVSAQILKINLFLLFVFFFFKVCFLELSVFSSRSVFDFMSIITTFLLWFLFLFTLTTLFAVVFFLELLSVLVLLLLVSSAFTVFRTSTVEAEQKSSGQFSESLDGFLYFFWISFTASIFLFVSAMYFKFFFFSFEWTFLELSLAYSINGMVVSNFLAQNCVWVALMVSFFIKTGVAPFFIWKTVLFKNSSLITIFFYTVVYYFFFILFLFFFFSSYLPSFTAYFVFSYTVLFSIGFIILFFILCDTTYLKVFLALSSVFNSLFVFCTLVCTNDVTAMFLL